MAFDGVTYPRASLISPATYHPGNGSIPDVLAGALACAYWYARKGSRLIGHQTYNSFLGDASATNLLDYFYASNSPVDIARFTRYVPPHATHVVADIYYKAWSIRPSIAQHDLTVDGISVPGTAAQEEIDPAFAGIKDFLRTASAENLETRKADLLERASLHNARVEVPLEGLTLDKEVEFVVQGNLVNKQANGESYKPESVSCYWYSVG